MELKNCDKCGTLFINKGSDLCSSCLEEERKKFREVKNYLWNNPGSTLEEIHQQTKISKKLIRKFIQEGCFKQI